MKTRFGFVVGIFLFFGAAILRAAPPQIAQFGPFALAPGKTNDLTLRGQSLQGARSIWATFPTRCEFLPAADESDQKGEKLVCRLTLPREAQVGIGALRLVTAEGVSNPILVMLDDLPTAAESPDNHAVEQAQPIQFPIAVDGQCDAVQEDLFRFPAAAGQRVSFEVIAQRLGSKLDPILRIVSANGAEVLRLDDAAGSSGDARFVHTFAAAGDYLLGLRDVRHAGGGEYRYRLRIGNFPLVASVYPAGGRSGAVMSFAILGQAPEPASLLNAVMPNVAVSPRVVSFSVPSLENAGSGWFQVEANPGNETLELEPNDSPAEATPAQLLGAINGRFDKAGDRDCFKFRLTKGQRLHFVAKTRELGSPCDVQMSLHKADGTQIAVARQEAETVLDADTPEDGDYVLQVEDLLVGGGLGHVYRIDATKPFAGFGLAAEQTQYSAPQGGTFVVKVLAQRRGYDGPIDLSVAGLGDGVTLEGNKLEGGEGLLKITLPSAIPQGEVRLAAITGTAKIGEATVSVQANQRAPLMAVFPNTLSLPTELEDSIAVGVGPPFPPFFELSVASPELIFPQLVGASSFDVNIQRSNDAFKDPVTIAVEGLPPEIKATIAPVGDGLAAVRVSLQGPADLPEREAIPLRIVGTGRFQEQTRTVVVQNLALRVTKPLAVSITMAGPIAAGGGQQADVLLQRFGDEPQPVRLQISDGPAGLSAPIFVTVPADASQIKIPITADAAAPAGKFNNLVVVATTVVKGQNVAITSKPAIVEVLPKANP
jgi:hypothetical protein